MNYRVECHRPRKYISEYLDASETRQFDKLYEQSFSLTGHDSEDILVEPKDTVYDIILLLNKSEGIRAEDEDTISLALQVNFGELFISR